MTEPHSELQNDSLMGPAYWQNVRLYHFHLLAKLLTGALGMSCYILCFGYNTIGLSFEPYLRPIFVAAITFKLS